MPKYTERLNLKYIDFSPRESDLSIVKINTKKNSNRKRISRVLFHLLKFKSYFKWLHFLSHNINII